MSKCLARFIAFFLFVSLPVCLHAQTPMDWRSAIPWEEPALVAPSETPGGAPSDAVILFDGKNLDAWDHQKWSVADDVLTVKPGAGDIRTKEAFGSFQLHLEFASPAAVSGKEQGRGNSGIFLMDTYEVQVLDSYDNPTYFDGQCAGIYKQRPPYVNACKKPGEWQTYDIFFTRPIFTLKDEKIIDVVRPAYVTVVQNGVLVVNNYAIEGNTHWHLPPAYTAIADKMPLRLQDHGNLVKYRNIWIREIPDANFKPQRTDRPYYNDAESKEKEKFRKLLKEEKAKWEAEQIKKEEKKKEEKKEENEKPDDKVVPVAKP